MPTIARRKASEFPQGLHTLHLQRDLFDLFLRTDERIVGLTERVQDRLLVEEKCRPILRLGRAYLSFDCAEREYRTRHSRRDGPRGRGTGEEIAERRTGGPEQSCK